MVTIAVIGLGTFGCRVVEELEHVDAEVIILDKNRDVVEKYKGRVRDAYITDAINEQTLKKILPEDINSVVVDLGKQIEASILVTNYLHKMGIKQIVAKAGSDEHGEILKLVGATFIIYPDLDAAQRITPILVSSILFNYMQVSPDFALAEVAVRKDLVGKTLVESNLRQQYKLNLVAVRKNSKEEFTLVNDLDLRFEKEMFLLVAGTNDAMMGYVEHVKAERKPAKTFLSRLFLRK